MIVTTHAPPRGYFTSRFALPIETPEVLVGPRGEIARRIETIGQASAIYQMAAFAEQLDHVATNYDGTVATASYLFPAPAGVDPQFVLHPALADDPTRLLRQIEIDGEWTVPTVTPYSSSSVHRSWRVDARLGDVAVILWLHFATMTSIVEVEGIVRSVSGAAVRPHVRLECAEHVVEVLHGGCTSTLADGNIVSIQAIADTAAWHPFQFRVTAKMVGEVDITEGSDPIAELTAGEHEWASHGPWFGMEVEDGFGDLFLGLPLALTPEGVARSAIEAWADSWTAARPLAPRKNPNAGGTDDAFGAVCSVPFNESQDPRIVRALLWSAEAWMGHPIHYSEPGTVRPLDPPPAHDGLTTHKLQPWKGKIGETVVPVGRSTLLGQDPFDPQHRAFMLPITMRALTGSPMLGYWVDHWMGSELFDRDTRVGWSGNGRQVGRILYNVVPAYLTNPVQGWLDYAIEVARQSQVEVDKLTTPNDRIRPCFISDRGLPWVGWTPWEEAQRAIGLYQLWQVTQDPAHRSAAYEAAYTVASVVGLNDGIYWLPYRCRFSPAPDVSSMQSPDVYSPNAGPNGLFGWSAGALRLLCHLRPSGPVDAVTHRAALAVQWVDEHMRDHVVDAQMAMRCAWGFDVDETAAAPIG